MCDFHTTDNGVSNLTCIKIIFVLNSCYNPIWKCMYDPCLTLKLNLFNIKSEFALALFRFATTFMGGKRFIYGTFQSENKISGYFATSFATRFETEACFNCYNAFLQKFRSRRCTQFA